MAAEIMPEPPDRALVGLFDPSGERVPLVFERDDYEDGERPEPDHWFATADVEAYTWAEVLRTAEVGDEVRRQVVRLYRADEPALFRSDAPAEIREAFNAGVEAAAMAIEAHAESIGWYEGGGVWADAIEEARKAVKN